MQSLFWLSWCIDLLILVVCLYETFAVSSNSSMAIPAVIMLILVLAAWWLRLSRPQLALALVGIPAGLLVAFALIALLLMMGKKDWR